MGPRGPNPAMPSDRSAPAPCGCKPEHGEHLTGCQGLGEHLECLMSIVLLYLFSWLPVSAGNPSAEQVKARRLFFSSFYSSHLSTWECKGCRGSVESSTFLTLGSFLSAVKGRGEKKKKKEKRPLQEFKTLMLSKSSFKFI